MALGHLQRRPSDTETVQEASKSRPALLRSSVLEHFGSFFEWILECFLVSYKPVDLLPCYFRSRRGGGVRSFAALLDSGV